MAKVSVVIPTYNNAQYLSEAIESVLAQTYSDYEIIIVNDGSTDKTSEVAKRYENFICYMEQENCGPSVARNRGIKNAKSKYITFLDADDVFLENKLALQVGYLESHPDVDLVYSDGYRYRMVKNGNERFLSLSKAGNVYKKVNNDKDFVSTLMTQNLFPIHACTVKKDVVDLVGGFDETLTAYEDWDLWYRISEIAQIRYIDGFVAKYRVTPNSNSTDLKRNLREAEKVMQKISASHSFQHTHPKNKSVFYYRLGITELFLEKTNDAATSFQKSISYHRNAYYSYSALGLVKLFGRRAASFFSIKRKLFGKRGTIEV